MVRGVLDVVVLRHKPRTGVVLNHNPTSTLKGFKTSNQGQPERGSPSTSCYIATQLPKPADVQLVIFLPHQVPQRVSGGNIWEGVLTSMASLLFLAVPSGTWNLSSPTND